MKVTTEQQRTNPKRKKRLQKKLYLNDYRHDFHIIAYEHNIEPEQLDSFLDKVLGTDDKEVSNCIQTVYINENQFFVSLYYKANDLRIFEKSLDHIKKFTQEFNHLGTYCEDAYYADDSIMDSFYDNLLKR